MLIVSTKPHNNAYTLNTVYAEYLADIKFGDFGANMSWLTFSLANQLSSEVGGDFNMMISANVAKLPN